MRQSGYTKVKTQLKLMKEVKVNIRHKLGKTTKIKQQVTDKESLTEIGTRQKYTGKAKLKHK